METELLHQILDQSGWLLGVSLLVSVAFGVLCGVIAARRGAKWVFWSVMGFAFGPFAVPFVFLSKKPGDKVAGSR
jgi:ABC-type dipeptide/oligopeptide/nickel transport system permease component